MRASHIVAAIACIITIQAQSSPPSLLQLLNTTSDLSSLSQLLRGPSGNDPFGNQLNAISNITIFAPNNDAYATQLALYNSPNYSTTYNNKDLPSLFLFGVINGTYSSLRSGSFLSSMTESFIYSNITGGQKLIVTSPTTVLSGLLQTATLIRQNLTFNGGVLHIIDKFFVVPKSISPTLTAFNLTSAWGALNTTNTMQAIQTLSDITAFIPTNAAFQSIGSGLPSLTIEQLSAILQYHAFRAPQGESPFYITENRVGSSYTSLQGNSLTIRKFDNTFFVNNARVIIPNILTANGVIHIIDQVLNPTNSTLPPFTGQSSGVPAFSGASSASQAPFTSGVPTPTSSITATGTGTPGGASNSGSSGSSNNSNIGAIAGGVVGGVAAIVLIVLGIWFWRRKGYSLRLHVEKKPQTGPKSTPAMAKTDGEQQGEFDQKAELAGSTALKGVVSRAELSAAERAELEAQERGQRGEYAKVRQSEVAELEANNPSQLNKKSSLLRK